MQVDWNDLRYFLAMLEEGSSKRAAALLKVNQTTCVRRISALEAALGIDLFSREEGRYVPTAHALDLRDAVSGVGLAVQRFEKLAESRKRSLSGLLKVTCEEVLVPMVLLPAIAELRQTYPDVSIDLDVGATLRDIEAGEADFAIRANLGPIDDELIWQKLGEDPLGAYCSEAYQGAPASIEELLHHPLICYDVHALHIRDLAPTADIRHVSNSWRAILGLVAEGAGVGIVPKIVASNAQNLQLCIDLPNLAGIWVVYPQQLKRVPYVRELQRLVGERFNVLVGKAMSN